MKQVWPKGMAITVMMVLGLFASTAACAATHYKMCRANEKGNRYSLCQTSVQPAIEVLCSQYQPKDAPPTAGVPVRAYDCTYEGEGASRKVTCKGGQFTRAPSKTLTYEEFVDSDKRCSTLCDPCSSGWESWQ